MEEVENLFVSEMEARLLAESNLKAAEAAQLEAEENLHRRELEIGFAESEVEITAEEGSDSERDSTTVSKSQSDPKSDSSDPKSDSSAKNSESEHDVSDSSSTFGLDGYSS